MQKKKQPESTMLVHIIWASVTRVHTQESLFSHCDRVFWLTKTRYYTIYFLPNSSVLSYNFFQIPIIIFILQKKKIDTAMLSIHPTRFPSVPEPCWQYQYQDNKALLISVPRTVVSMRLPCLLQLNLVDSYNECFEKCTNISTESINILKRTRIWREPPWRDSTARQNPPTKNPPF